MKRPKRNGFLSLFCAAALLASAASGVLAPPTVPEKRKSVSYPSEESSSALLSFVRFPSSAVPRPSSVPAAISSAAGSVSDPPPSRSSSANPVSSFASNAEEKTRTYYDVPLAADIQDLIFLECSTRKVPADLVVAVIGVESGFNPSMVSRTNDYGLMQINICHKDFLRKKLQVTDLLDERQNIKAGVYMLSDLVNRYEDRDRALMAYNCGEAGAKRLWEKGVYSTAYSRKVIETAAELRE